MKAQTVSYILLLFTFAFTAPAFANPDKAAITFPTDTLTIVTSSGQVKFSVEVATTSAQQEFGLMFRQSMPQDHGMIFNFGAPRPIEMWMKNTILSLDMVFIDKNDLVTKIVKNAKPESTDIISSGSDVTNVLELNGGAADYYHIAEGNHVLYHK